VNGSRYGIDSNALVLPREAKKLSHPSQRAQRVGTGLRSKLEHSLSHLDRAAAIDRVQISRPCDFVPEDLS